MKQNFIIKDNINFATVLKNFPVKTSAEKQNSITLLDTFDFRLFNSNKFADFQEDRLTFKNLDKDKKICSIKTQLKEKFFADELNKSCKDIAQIIENRALIPYSANTLIETDYELTFNEKNILIKRKQLFNKSLTIKVLDFIQIDFKTKNKNELDKFINQTFADNLTKTKSSLIAELIKIIKPPTLNYKNALNFSFDKNDDFSNVASVILKRLTDVLMLNFNGLRNNFDTECLHDFRVSLRKIRTFLEEFSIVLPDEAEYFKENFKKTQQKTNLLRDIDVFIERKKYFQKIFNKNEIDDFNIFFNFIKEKREDEFLSVKKYFHAPNFHILLKKWNNFLEDIKTSKTHKNIYKVSKPIIFETAIKTLKTAEKIAIKSDFNKIHKLRILTKKFRYNLDFFKNIYSKSDTDATINELKRFQNYLGQLTDYQQITLFIKNQLQDTKSPQNFKSLQKSAYIITKVLFIEHRKLLKKFDKYFEILFQQTNLLPFADENTPIL